MKLKNSDYAKNARKRVIQSIKAQELRVKELEEIRKKRIEKQRRLIIEDAEYVEFEEIKDNE